MTEKKAPEKAELKADAKALAAKIKSVPNFEKDDSLKFAFREAINCTNWLSK